MYLSLYCKGSKRLFKVLLWEGAADRTELQYIDPYSYGRQRCVFLVLQGCSTGGWMMAFFTASYQQLVWSPNSIGLPKGPFGMVWLSLPQLVSYSNCLTSVLIELYNSSTPTQSLEWHVWSSSSGNNCHASLRSETFTLSHIISRAHLRDFLS